MRTVNAFWWNDGGKNWGDVFSEFLFAKLYGVSLQHTQPEKASLVCAGSILEHLPNQFTGTVLGTGMMYSKTHKDLTRARVLLLRGKETRKRCMLSGLEPRLGDPGILAYLFSTPTKKKFRYAIIPHYIDRGLPEVAAWKKNPEALVVDITAGIYNVIDKVMQCERLISSSLHGLVLADSLGIPNRWIELSNRVCGEGFKFLDYYSVYGQHPKLCRDIAAAFRECETRNTTRIKADVKYAFDAYVGSLGQ